MQNNARLVLFLSMLLQLICSAYPLSSSAEQTLSSINIRKAEKVGDKILLSDGMSYRYCLRLQSEHIKLSSCADDILAVSRQEAGTSAELLKQDDQLYVRIDAGSSRSRIDLPKYIQENLLNQPIRAIFHKGGSTVIVSRDAIFELKKNHWSCSSFGKKLSRFTIPVGFVNNLVYFLTSRGEYGVCMETLDLRSRKWKTIFTRQQSESCEVCSTKDFICILLEDEIFAITPGLKLARINVTGTLEHFRCLTPYGECGIALATAHEVIKLNDVSDIGAKRVHFEKLVNLPAATKNSAINLLYASPEIVLITDADGLKVLDQKSGAVFAPIVTDSEK